MHHVLWRDCNCKSLHRPRLKRTFGTTPIPSNHPEKLLGGSCATSNGGGTWCYHYGRYGWNSAKLDAKIIEEWMWISTKDQTLWLARSKILTSILCVGETCIYIYIIMLAQPWFSHSNNSNTTSTDRKLICVCCVQISDTEGPVLQQNHHRLSARWLANLVKGLLTCLTGKAGPLKSVTKTRRRGGWLKKKHSANLTMKVGGYGVVSKPGMGPKKLQSQGQK